MTPIGPRRWASLVVAAALLQTGCVSSRPAPTPVAPPTTSPAASGPASPSPGPSVAATGRTVPMSNLGLEVTLEEPWTVPSELTDADRATFRQLDPEFAAIVEDAWQGVRITPGGDLGLLATDPSAAMVFVARWMDERDQGLDLRALMDRAEGRAVRDDEVGPSEVLGRDGLTASIRETVGGVARAKLLVVTRLADGRAAAFSVTGPAATFDDAAAQQLVASISETELQPQGKPWREVRDAELEERLGTLGYDQLVSGDLWTLVRSGGAQGSLLFDAAITSHPAISADPAAFRGARTGPSERGSTGFAEVSALRIAGEDTPSWAPLDEAFTQQGYANGRVGRCEGRRANPTPDGHAGALIADGDALYLFEAPDLASIIEVVDKVLDC